MPDSRCFASGETVAVALRISCPQAPALARLLSHNAHLSLVKRQKTWISLGAQISIREQVLSRAELYLADESREGTVYLRLEVQTGEPGREASWKVENAVSVEVRCCSVPQSRAPVLTAGFFLSSLAYIAARHFAARAPEGFPGVQARGPAEAHDGSIWLVTERGARHGRRAVPGAGAE